MSVFPKITVIPVGTFSIVGRCARTNMLGVGVASKYLAVGAVCSHSQPNVGAISTQAYGNPYLGIDGLALLDQGEDVQTVLEQLLQQDPGREKRQLIIIDRHGHSAAFTGSATAPWTGHQPGKNCVAAGNMLTGPEVIQQMVQAFENSADEELAERILRAMEAGQAAGGDKRGKQAAHLQVVHTEDWKYVDLRVDEHTDPVTELRRIFEVAKRELFPFREFYPTRAQPDRDWDIEKFEQLSTTFDG